MACDSSHTNTAEGELRGQWRSGKGEAVEGAAGVIDKVHSGVSKDLNLITDSETYPERDSLKSEHDKVLFRIRRLASRNVQLPHILRCKFGASKQTLNRYSGG